MQDYLAGMEMFNVFLLTNAEIYAIQFFGTSAKLMTSYLVTRLGCSYRYDEDDLAEENWFRTHTIMPTVIGTVRYNNIFMQVPRGHNESTVLAICPSVLSADPRTSCDRRCTNIRLSHVLVLR